MSTAYIPAALRRLVYERASGYCEYCLIPEAGAFQIHEIDHVVAEKHGGATLLENLALSCISCNRRKGSDLSSIDPETQLVTTLYHPRRDRWRMHFYLNGAEISPSTATGRATIFLFRLNMPTRVRRRQLLLESNSLGLTLTQ